MDPSQNQNQNPYYYPQHVPDPLYAAEVYLPDAEPAAPVDAGHPFAQHLYHAQQHEQYAYRYPPPQQQQQRPDAQPQASFHPPLGSPPQPQHDPLRHAQPLAACTPPLRHSPTMSDGARSTRSSPCEASTSYLPAHGDPLAALRSDLQVHAAAAALTQAQAAAEPHYAAAASAVPRLPPILQVEKQQVTTTATQVASASRRRNEATFRCPVPGCGSTFTRRFNLKGHLRSHTSERPYVCEWPGCGKGFARQHDCKRHYQLHSAKAGTHMCHGCGKSFSRTDALNRHLRSEGGVECRPQHLATPGAGGSTSTPDLSPGDSSGSPGDSATDGAPSRPRSV